MLIMAFYDDRKFLLSHIHHSFITCDDTGMCELTMLNEVVTDKALIDYDSDTPEAKALNYYADALESELLEGAQSVDIISGMGLISGHRYRSNTAQRLERLKKERQVQARITHVHWKDYSTELSETELSQLFPKKELVKQEAKQPVKSALSEALELYPAVPNNPFGEYARFDGRINTSAPTKKILIYLTMLLTEERNYGMEVVCLSNARVQDLIGLICWMYTNEGKEPNLKPNVSDYCLKIAEETGEVDDDFPSLDIKELVGKFGFPYLALVERPSKGSLIVTIHVEEECYKVEVPSLDITLRNAADLACNKISSYRSQAYHLEKLEEPGVAIYLEKKLSDFTPLVFRLVFEDNVRARMMREIMTEEYNTCMKAVEAPLYQSYNASLCQKIGINYDVQLGISGEKVEINPLPQKGAAKLLSRQQKPTTIYMDTIGTCEIISKKYNPGRSTFRLVHQNGTEFKKYIFESNQHTASEIVKKIQIILDMTSSTAQKEYQLYQERKLRKKTQKSQQNLSRT